MTGSRQPQGAHTAQETLGISRRHPHHTFVQKSSIRTSRFGYYTEVSLDDGLFGRSGNDSFDGGAGDDRCAQGAGTGPKVSCGR